MNESAKAELLASISQATRSGDRETTVALTGEALERGFTPEEILEGGLVTAMDVIGEGFSAQEIFVPEMLVAARAMKGSMELLRPVLASSDSPQRGTCVIGTVDGDVHDIGQNLVAMMWEGAGFVVHNLGVMTKGAEFVDAIKEHRADIVGMSALLTTTMMRMRDNIELFKEEGLGDKAKVLIGGAPTTQEFAADIGADGWALDAGSAAELAKRIAAGLDPERW